MISFEVDSEDVGGIVRAVRSVTGADAFRKISGIRLGKDVLIFEQRFALKTTVSVKLSCDESGKLLIGIVSLAENGIGKYGLGLFQGSILNAIENSTGGRLVRESDSVLSFDPREHLPFPLEFRTVSICDGRLSVQLVLP